MNLTALITGASSGIGYEFARVFAENNYDVFLVARREDRLKVLKERIESETGKRAEVLPYDLSNPEVAEEIYQQTGPVDALINNAGVGQVGRYSDRTWAADEFVMNLNLLTPMHLAKLYLSGMLENNQGGVINVASITGLMSSGPFMSTYFSSKAAMVSWSYALAEECSGTDVNVLTLCPGPVRTELAGKTGAGDKMIERFGMDPYKVAQIGYKSLQKGKRLVIPGVLSKLLVYSSKLLPRRAEAFINRKMQEKHIDS
jgi:hypothetical protein